MDTLNFSENLVRLRRDKKVTQGELADFIGVTKASVSKWENHQSLPDILLLPKLAAFFDVSVDELLGYAPQLGREQIQKIYHELSAQFAEEPFESVMVRCREYVKKYYSCYSFLFQICVLWLNHFMLADQEEKKRGILEETLKICEHILKECKDIHICNDTVILQSGIRLQLGQVQEVIEVLEEVGNPYRLSQQSDAMLIQAYQIAGENERADAYTQISMYLHLISLIDSSMKYLEIHSEDLERCEETIRRVDGIFELYGITRLHGNSAAVFQLQSAMVFCIHEREAEALERLESYVQVIEWMLTDENLSEHEDAYFDKIQSWYEGCDLGAEAPRNKKTILDSALVGLEHPIFEKISGTQEFQRLKKRLMKQD